MEAPETTHHGPDRPGEAGRTPHAPRRRAWCSVPPVVCRARGRGPGRCSSGSSSSGPCRSNAGRLALSGRAESGHQRRADRRAAGTREGRGRLAAASRGSSRPTGRAWTRAAAADALKAPAAPTNAKRSWPGSGEGFPLTRSPSSPARRRARRPGYQSGLAAMRERLRVPCVDNEELPAELKALEAQLAALVPDDQRLDRATLLFAAGRASARRRARCRGPRLGGRVRRNDRRRRWPRAGARDAGPSRR